MVSARTKETGEGIATLNGVVRVGLIEKVTFEQRIKGRDGVGPAGGKAFQTEH